MPSDPERARKCHVASVVVALVGIALQSLIVDRAIVPIDEGQISSFAERILRGEVIYRDFYTGVFPAIYYFTAALFGVFGHDLLTTRVAQLVLNVAIAVLIHRIALRVATPFWAFVWATAYFPIVVASFPTLTMLTYSPLSMTFALAALACALAYLGSPGRGRLVACGVLLVACGLAKQNYGAFAAAGVMLTLLVSPVAVVGRKRSPFGAAATVGLAGAVVAAVALAPLLVAGAGPRLLRYTVGTLLTSQMDAFDQPIPPLLDAAPSQAGNFLFYYLPNVLLGYALRGEPVVGVTLTESLRWTAIRAGYGGALLLLAAGWVAVLLELAKERTPGARARLGVVVFAQLMFLGLFPSAIWSHLATVLPPLLILGAIVGASLTRALAAWPSVGRLVSGVAAAALLASVLVAAGVARDVRRWNATPLGLERASLHVTEPDARILGSAVAFLRECAAEGAPVFVAPDLPVLYFLSRRTNASPYEMLIPGDIDERLLIDTLEAADTRCIVYNPSMYSHFAPLTQSHPGFTQWLDASFVVGRTIGGGEREWLGLVRKPETRS